MKMTKTYMRSSILEKINDFSNSFFFKCNLKKNTALKPGVHKTSTVGIVSTVGSLRAEDR